MAGSRSLRSTRARSGWAARSTACHPDSRPFFLPTGVRTTSTITAFGIRPFCPILRGCPKSGRVSDFPYLPPNDGPTMDQPMDLRFTPPQAAFRHEARSWLASHAPPPRSLPSLDTAEGFEAHRAWEQTMFDDRWSVVSWPEQFGGRGVGILEWLVFEEEYWRAEAPLRVSQNGVFLLAPTMFEFGTEEQQGRFLPSVASGAEIWCQGWSEPDAGSDL